MNVADPDLWVNRARVCRFRLIHRSKVILECTRVKVARSFRLWRGLGLA
jgi:hypothetical protein